MRFAFLLLCAVLASGCSPSRRSLLSPNLLPTDIPLGAQIQTAPQEGSHRFFAELLGDHLREHGVETDTSVSASPVPRLRVAVESTTYRHILSRGVEKVYYVPEVPSLVIGAEFATAPPQEETYLSLRVPMHGRVLGSTRTQHQQAETLLELLDRGAQFVAVLYLNALGGEPEPLEGVWVTADGEGRPVFDEYTAERRSAALTSGRTVLYALSNGNRTPFITTLEVGAVTEELPYGRMTSEEQPDSGKYFKGRCLYKTVGADAEAQGGWQALGLHIHGCLMVIDTNMGQAFLVKNNLGRCVPPR